MNYLVIYPGRFHPFHRGHRASYEYLAKKYGEDHVYIATTGVQAPVTSPFTFADKVQMISTLGIPAGHVVKVSNPYQSREITDSIPSEEKANTVLIFALSAKDAERFNFAPKRDGTPSYLQPMPKNLKQLKPMTKHAYVEITPTVNFKVRGQDANSASQIREFYIKGNNNDRDQIIADLYGEAYPELRDIFDERLGVTEQVQKIVREARQLKTARSVALLERILTKERRALNEFTHGMTEGREQITELRDRMYQYIKSIVPTWPDYVVKDWLYGNLATGETYNKEKGWSFETIGKGIPKILNDTGLSVDTTWQLVPNVKFTMDMWEPKTLKRLQARAGGSATSTDPMVHIPARDAERHATQAALAQQQGGVRKEPVIIVKTPRGYELLEGWHRTIQHFARYPNGYTGPAYVAVAQGQQGVAEAATDDPKFQKMMGNIQKTTPDPFSGYVAVSYASEKPSKKIKGATVNGKPVPTTTDDPGQLINDLKFTSDRIEQQLMAIGKKHGWDLIDPGQGQGYSELYFDTNREYTTNTQRQLATNIVKTVNEINKFFASMNRSLQATGLPVYQVNVWQGLGANGNINQIDDINQITNIAQGKDAKADPGPAIGHIILKYIPGYEAENDELGYDLEDFANAKKVASIYIAKGEQAGLQAQHRLDDHVSNMIDELLSDHGGSGLRTVRDLDEGVAEGESPADTLYFFDIGRGGRSFTNVDLRAMGLQQSQSGKWYYRPGVDSTPLLLKTTLDHLAKQLNVPPKPWQRPQTNEGIRDVLNFGIKKPTVKPAEPVDDFTAKMIANKQKNLKIVHPKDVYKSPDEYTRATGNKIKESADYLEEK